MPPIRKRPTASPPPGKKIQAHSVSAAKPARVSDAQPQHHTQPHPQTRLAVNMFDSDRIDPLTRQILLGGRVNLDNAVLVVTDGRASDDDVGIEFTCDLLTAACMVHAMRNMDARNGRRPTRAYKCLSAPGSHEAWQSLPADEPLIIVVDNQCTLNLAVFPPPPISENDMDFSPEDVIFGQDD